MKNKEWDQLYVNGTLCTLDPADSSFGLIKDGALAIKDNLIAWLGKRSDLPADYSSEVEINLNQQVLTPGLIDCHTHLVYAGNRADEFEKRLNGATYEEIAKSGGGILSTVKATRQASFDELLEQTIPRAKQLKESGVTTVEIKSGYGLDFDSEIKILKVAKKIGELLGLRVKTTFLGAHSIPPEFKNRAEDYINFLCAEMIPVIANEKLADFVDVFSEKIAFNLEQTKKIFECASEYGLGIKCHAEQLSNIGATELAARFKAVSVDHLEFLDEDGVKAIAKSGTTAVLLPGAFYFLREQQLPPIDLLRKHEVPIAIATDCNPGTSPVTSLTLIMNMACTLFRLTPLEALRGVTINAAKALGMENKIGSLEVGKIADVAIWDIRHPAELSYSIGFRSSST
jgi:imidazolonepropionase